jgi:hypothetical protein
MKRYKSALVVLCVVSLGILAVRCSEEAETDESGLRAPTAAELLGAWRVIRANASGSSSETMAYDDTTQSSILDIGDSLLVSFELQESFQGDCYCPDTALYALSGNRVTGEAFSGDTTEDGITYTWNTTWAIQSNQLVITYRLTMSGNDTSSFMSGPASGTATMTAYYDAYNGALPTNLCGPTCNSGLFKSSQTTATEISGRWMLDRVNTTEQGSWSASGTLLDTTWLFNATADTIYEYTYDTSLSTTCHYLDQSEYLLDGGTLKGSDYYFNYDATGYSESINTTIGFNSSNELVVTWTYQASASETEGANSATYLGSQSRTMYMVPYDGRVPPGTWPQTVCPYIIFKDHANASTSSSPLVKKLRTMPGAKLLAGG